MATAADAEKEYARLQEFLTSTDQIDLTEGRVGFVRIKNVRYTLDQVRALRADAENRIAQLDTVLAPVREAQAKLARAEEIARNPIVESPTGMSQAQADADVADAREELKRVTTRQVNIPKAAPLAAAPAAPAAGLTAEQKKALRGRGEVAGGMGATAPRKAEEEPAPSDVVGGAAVGAGRGATVVTGGKTRRKLPANWEAKFREMFPGQAWYLDVDPAKYPDIKKIVQDAVINKAWETPESQARFLEQFKGSSFYKELQSTQKIRQVKAVVGDLGFDTVPFNQFLTKAMNLGWDGDTLKFEAYKEAFRKDDAGAYVNPTAVERVRKSNDYLSVSNIGKAFFSTVSDETVQRTLMGDMTNEDVQRQQRELAKTKYGHLAPLLDQGLTLMDIGDTFRTTASQILEKDPNTIDMSQSDYEVALNFGEPGQKRVMTNGEWERLLRTDRKYGWENTENAKAEARRLADSITKAFGRVI